MWIPKDLDELRAALVAGSIEEGHYVDFKRELSTTKSEKIAIDLANFAVDGGVIYIGVAQTGSVAAVSPVTLSGLPERTGSS